jgi:SAM-dependent methyltransferase
MSTVEAVVPPAAADTRRAVKPGVRRFYDVLARHGALAPFLNYGWADEQAAPVASANELLALHAAALYRRALAGVALSGARVLEAGCGRGGGAATLLSESPIARYLGIDLSSRQVALARRRLASHRAAAVTVADAEAPPVADGAFEVAISVEAAHHFEQLGAFFAAIHRALVPNGTFVVAGIFVAGAPTEGELAHAGFALDGCEDLTPGVLRSLAATSERRRELVEALPLPSRFRPFLLSWAGVAGTPVYERFAAGSLRYLCYRVRRERGAAA